ncbi:hypothetical protein BJV74DRAFT_800037 [Russula compacta]|nr:hypothetical protein BJV74DRAFT_800037 [Russula compacta]
MPSNPSNNGKKSCHVCGGTFCPQMIAAHVKKCERMKEAEEGLVKYESEVRHKVERLLACPSGSNAADPLTSNNSGPSGSPDPWPVLEIAGCMPLSLEPFPYHPRSSKPSKAYHPKVYSTRKSSSRDKPNLKPWWPFFKTCEDFLILEILIDSSLSNAQLDKLLKLINHCINGEQRLFDVIYHPLWDWATNLIWEPQFTSQFHWDAKKIFQCSGQSFTYVFHEPWTSDVFWDAQIPDGGHVLALILYANKMKLSSFGTAKGYPIVTRCVNLLTEIRNGDGFSGGCIIGWLPVVAEDPKESGKPEFINFKCVVWHTLFEKMHDVTNMTAADTQMVIKDACKLQSAAKHEKLLSHLSLHDVDNVFWNLSYSDLHCVLSFDWLHSNNNGLFGHHLWEQFKILIAGYGHSQEEQVDKQFDDVSFTDGSKYEDILKLIVFIAHNIIPSRNQESEGWLLLQCLQAFSIVDLYLAFEAHTEHTITSGWCELESFAQCMKKYIHAFTSCGESNKSWHFPKMHVLVHSFDDIKQKGVTCNYNMKPNEKLHGPLKKTYKMHTNFKDVGPQILKLEHLKFIFSSIHSQLDNVECIENKDEDVDKVPEVLSSSHPLPDVAQVPQLQGCILIDGHIDLRSQQLTMTFTAMEESLHTSLASWLTKELPAYDFDKAGDYLVMDVVDHTRDLFLHCTTPPFSAQQENIISNYNGKDALVEEEQIDE